MTRKKARSLYPHMLWWVSTFDAVGGAHGYDYLLRVGDRLRYPTRIPDRNKGLKGMKVAFAPFFLLFRP